MAPHLFSTPAVAGVLCVSGSCCSTAPPSTPPTSWHHPSTRLLRKVCARKHVRMSVTALSVSTQAHMLCCFPIRSQRVSGAAAVIRSTHRHGAASGGDAAVLCLHGGGRNLCRAAASLRYCHLQSALYSPNRK